MKRIISFLMLISIVCSTYVYASEENLTGKQKQDVWFNSAVGRAMDSDGVNGTQNVDVAYDYTNAIFGNWRNTIGLGDAGSLFNTSNTEYFIKIANDPTDANQVPLHGDIIIWKNHIAVVESANSDGLTILQQKNTRTEKVFLNWVVSYKVNGGYPLGWLRPNLDKIGILVQTPISSPIQQAPNKVIALQPISIDPKGIGDSGGGLNLKLWCKYKGYSDISSPASNKPYDWKCKDAKNNLYGIDMNNACQIIYGSEYTSILTDSNSALSWKCKKPIITTNNPILPIDKTISGWYGLTYPKHEKICTNRDCSKSTLDWNQYSAIDINLAGDADKGKIVYAIQDGKVTQSDVGILIIKHSVPLTLKNGTIIQDWSSLYGHMANQVANGTIVKKGDIIGYISNKGANNYHLHFSIFRKYSKIKTDAISPYWLPNDYSNGTMIYADDADPNTPDLEGTEPGLYKNRIYSNTPLK